MKNYFNRQWVFNIVLCILSFMAKKGVLNPLTRFLSSCFARLNLAVSKAGKPETPKELAEKWKAFMPFDGQDLYKLTAYDDVTASAEIHLHCPLRGSGDVLACYKLMNYDRTLMHAIGGELIVLESQSNSGEQFCKLAIRKEGTPIDDLVPAHLKIGRRICILP